MDLVELRTRSEEKEREFETTLSHFGVDRWIWYKAVDRAANGTASKDQLKLADNEQIQQAHDVWIEALHDYYRARDGAKGFLGSHGL